MARHCSSCTCTAEPKGWIYCLENASMPGLYKISSTSRTMTAELESANSGYDRWRPPTPYTLVIAKKKSDVDSWDDTGIRTILLHKGYTIDLPGDFVKAPLPVINRYFVALKGELYDPTLYTDA